VSGLADACRRQRDENAALRRKLEEQGQRLRVLEGQLLDANQRRQDVAKRIDELISQIDHLEGQLARAQG
jgi:septal ring factor EnvC (AmiA/AmiB activator)